MSSFSLPSECSGQLHQRGALYLCPWRAGDWSPELSASPTEHETPVPLAVPEPEPIEATTKRTICKFWQEGSCTRGSECTWAHGEEELGVRG